MQPALHELVLVRASPIPNQDEWTADVAPEMAKKAHHLGAPNVASRVQGQRQGELSATRRHDQGADAGNLLVRARANGQRRRQATRGPCAAEYRHHQEAGFIEADQVGAEAPEFFYPAPVTQDPVAHPPIVALLGAGLGPLGAEATRAEQSPDVIRMVDDFELTTDEVDDPSTRPQACAIAGRFRPRHHQAGQSMPLREAEFRRSTRRRAGAQPGAALSSVRALPSADGTPSDAEAPGHHMHRKVALEQFDGAQASLLELSRAPLWAHAVPPTAEYNFSRTLLTQVSLATPESRTN